jgi:Family of unknown function (DUF6461)
MTGLTWLASQPNVGSWPFCLTFVRGSTEREVFEGFGADPDDAVAAGATIPFGEVHDRPRVMVGRSGEWVFALEENITAQGTRPEVLRRVSARTEAVAIYNDIGKGNDEFAHAFNGEIITALTTTIPPSWGGSEPDRLRSLAEEIALDDDGESGLLGLDVLLALAEGVFGISLDEEDLSGPLAAAPMLPVLDDLRAPQPTQARPRVSDPVISLLLAHVPDESLTRVLSVRCGRVMTEAGVSDHVVLVDAIRDALAGETRSVTDDEPLGVALRTAGLHDAKAAVMLRFALAGRRFDALTTDFYLHRIAQTPGWREQLIADFGDLGIPASDLRAAEEAHRAQEHRFRFPPGTTEPEPAAAHVRRLTDAGMAPETIATLGGVTTPYVGRLLRGELPKIQVRFAQQILAIEVPV